MVFYFKLVLEFLNKGTNYLSMRNKMLDDSIISAFERNYISS